MESNEKNERQQYIEKLDNQVTTIKKVLSLGSNSVLDIDTEEKLGKLKDEASLLSKKLRNDEYEIAIVGMEKAGKSTFANALMENQFLPSKDARCTFTSTKIEYNDEDRDDYAKVIFFSTETFDKDFKDKLKTLGVEDAEKYSFLALDLSNYKQIYDDKVSEEKKRLYGDTLNEDIKSILANKTSISDLLDHRPMEIEADKDENGESGFKRLEHYITEPNTAYAVKEVTIKSKKLEKMKNAVIYDVPGFNSPTELHKIQTKKRMELADAIIVVANGEHPSITGDSLKILRESDHDGNQLQDKLFVFANRIGLAKDIEENKKTTYNEWIYERKFINSTNKDRIVFGSALAHLVKLFSPDEYESKDEFQKIEKLEQGDGIEAMRKVIEAYNCNERFNVLKVRINKIEASISEILLQLKEKYSSGINVKVLSPEHQKAFGHFLDEARRGITKELEMFREEILKKMYVELPLTNKIREYINKNVTKENYSITDELVEKCELRTKYAGNQAVSNIESGCREELFDKMYTEDFSDNVLSIADDFHKDCSERIIEAIMSGMGVDNNSFNYNEIKNLLRKELVPFRKEFAPNDGTHENFNIYESLIQRFTRDIYELLILSNYTTERLDRFYERIGNCLSMSIFYKKDNQVDDFTYLNVTPQDQPLWKMILFHNYLSNKEEVRKKFVKDIADAAGLREIPEELDEPINKCLDSAGGRIEEIVEDVRNEFEDLKRDVDYRLNRLSVFLYRKIGENETSSYSLADKPKFRDYYNKFHSDSCKGEYTTEYVRKEFDKDIEILREILMNGCVNAIDLEKPFVAREIRTIDRIKDYINNNGKFIDFLSNHFSEIRFEETKKLDAENAIREQKSAIANSISACLNMLNR